MFTTHTITANEVYEFNCCWPGSRLRLEDITFTFAPNQDLVDIECAVEQPDGPELLALSQVAQARAFHTDVPVDDYPSGPRI